MSGNRTKPTTGTVDTKDPKALLEAYPGLVMAIPLAEGGDGSEMVARVLAAESWEDLNDDEGALPNARAVKGKKLKCHGITRHESTEEGGIGWYLVIESTDVDTGELIRWQTSSMMVMSKLVKLSQLSCYPALVQVSEAESATKAGRKPLDMRVLSATPGGTPGY